MKKIITLISLSLALFVACDRVIEKKLRSYIVSFYTPEDIVLKLKKEGVIELSLMSSYHYHLQEFSFQSEGKNADRYNELCAKHNDLTYYKKTKEKTRYIHFPLGRTYSAADTKTVMIGITKDLRNMSRWSFTAIRNTIQVFILLWVFWQI